MHLPAIAWALFLGYLLLLPGSQLPEVGFGWVAEVSLGDKVMHALGFGILAWLGHRSLAAASPAAPPGAWGGSNVWMMASRRRSRSQRRDRPRLPEEPKATPPPASGRMIAAVLLAISYGGLLEVAQARVVPGRDGTVSDGVANAVGAVLYAGLAGGVRAGRGRTRGRIRLHESDRAPGERRAAAD